MPKRKKGSKFYAVAIGREPGIYLTWDECQSNVKGFSSARFKSFSTFEEAETFVASASSKSGRGKSVAAAEIEAFSKMAASTKQTQKRPRVVAAKKPKEPIQGSESNPISVESPSSSATAATAAAAASVKNKSKTTPQKLWFHIMFDGGSRGNPHGHAGSGTYILLRKFYNSKSESDAKTTKTKIARDTTHIRTYLGLGLLTNNQAEYTGLVKGLEQVLKALQKTNPSKDGKLLKDVVILVQGDSDLIVKQLKGIYACKSPKLKSYHKKSKELVKAIEKRCKTLGSTCDITFEHVYREYNKIADGLANEAMDAKRSWETSKGDNDSDSSDDGGPENDDSIEV